MCALTKILVIEDDPSLRENVEEMFMQEGYEVVSAADGVEGVNTAFSFEPDLIVCDIQMPRLDGYGVLLDVRTNSLTQFTPFIFLTARTTRDDMRAAMELGADDYVTKPFELKTLLRAVKTRLDRKTEQAEEYQEQIDLLKEVLVHERKQRSVKEKLVTMFSSDFRDPLASIVTSSSLLRDHIDRMDEQRRLIHLNRIEASARQLQQMLDDLHLIAQMENSSLQLQAGSAEYRAIYRETRL